MSDYNNPYSGRIQVRIVDIIPTYLQPGEQVMLKSTGVIYKGMPDCSVAIVDTSTDARLQSGDATHLYGKWNHSNGRYEALTLAEIKAALAYVYSDIFTIPDMLELLIPEGTPVNAVASSKVLTVADTPAEGETVTIGGTTYKARLDALGAGVAATGTLTFNSELPHDGDTIVLGNTTYTLKTALSTEPTVPNEILIEATVTDTIDNLIAAVDDGAGESTKYSTGTISQGMVTCTKPTADTFLVTYDTVGFLGNQYDTAGTLTHATWGETHLTGGIDPQAANDIFVDGSAENFIDNLVLAITKGAGESTSYGTGTVIHPTVTATKASASTMTTTAKTKGVVGNSIAISESLGNASSKWAGDATFLSGGIDGTVGTQWQMKKDATGIYVAVDNNTIADANWVKTALTTF